MDVNVWSDVLLRVVFVDEILKGFRVEQKRSSWESELELSSLRDDVAFQVLDCDSAW